MRSWTAARAEGRSGTRGRPVPGTPESRFLPGPRPRRIAHRGFALDGAENTMRAFQDALAHGADVLETDTRATRDGIALAFHDATLQRVADDPRRIADLSAADLSGIRVHGDEPLAPLAEVLDAFAHVPVNIDVKDMAAVAPAVAAIARTRAANRVCVTSFDDRVAAAAAAGVLRATGVLPVRSPSRAAMARFLAARSVEAPARAISRILAPYAALQVPVRHGRVRIVTAANIAAAHRAGCEVHVWTIDEPDEMRRLLALGVDGIVTNRVDLLTEATPR